MADRGGHFWGRFPFGFCLSLSSVAPVIPIRRLTKDRHNFFTVIVAFGDDMAKKAFGVFV